MLDEVTRRELIARYAEGPGVIREAIARLSEADLDRPAPDGGWTARQVVHHLADSELASAIRLRRLVAEDSPAIIGYDEGEYARRLHYDRPLEPSLQAIEGARTSTVSILESMSDEEWGRSGTHSEMGPYSVTGWLQIYAAHCHDHAEQIRRAITA
ncbi:MAG: DinB family protein [Candidatus Dormibacteria bacterium]